MAAARPGPRLPPGAPGNGRGAETAAAAGAFRGPGTGGVHAPEGRGDVRAARQGFRLTKVSFLAWNLKSLYSWSVGQ